VDELIKIHYLLTSTHDTSPSINYWKDVKQELEKIMTPKEKSRGIIHSLPQPYSKHRGRTWARDPCFNPCKAKRLVCGTGGIETKVEH